MKIREILNKIQVELHAPKNQVNNFGKYKYRSCEDILEGLKPLLKETGASLTITDELVISTVLETEIVVVAKLQREIQTQRAYIKATATITDEEGESISASAFARECSLKTGMDSSQVTGATSSYARKYALNGLFCIDDNKDADTMKAPESKVEEFIDDKQLNVLRDFLISLDKDEAKFCSFLKVSSLEVLPKSQYQQAHAALEASKKKNEAQDGDK